MKALRKWAAAYLIENKQKPQSLQDLDYAFVDSDGMRYYTWGDRSMLPQERLIEMEGVMMLAQSNIGPESLKNIAAIINEINMKAANEEDKKIKSMLHAQISAYTNELVFRSKYAPPKSVFISLAAMLTCREDEQPMKFTKNIYTEKCETFEKMSDEGHSFFFNTPILKELLMSYVGTEGWYKRLSERWEYEARHEAMRSELISSFTKSSDTKKKKKS